MSENVIQIKNLTKQFKTKFGTLTAVDDVSFDIRRGENFGLVGESGSGKSTIGSMIVGTYGPTSGSITFRDEIDISRSSQSREPSLKQQIQLVFQDPGGSLYPRKTIRQILSVPVQLYAGKRLTTAEVEARIKGILEQVGLPVHYLDKYPRAIGGGEKQLVCVARALAANPQFIVLDEPTAGLDPKGRDTILEQIRVYQEQIIKWGMIYQSRAVSLSQGDATERFEWFCKEYPGMVDMVNNRYIASFLGITPVTLSRLRHGVATKVGREKRTDEE